MYILVIYMYIFVIKMACICYKMICMYVFVANWYVFVKYVRYVFVANWYIFGKYICICCKLVRTCPYLVSTYVCSYLLRIGTYLSISGK